MRLAQKGGVSIEFLSAPAAEPPHYGVVQIGHKEFRETVIISVRSNSVCNDSFYTHETGAKD
jgi:hypothetical protein